MNETILVERETGNEVRRDSFASEPDTLLNAAIKAVETEPVQAIAVPNSGKLGQGKSNWSHAC